MAKRPRYANGKSPANSRVEWRGFLLTLLTKNINNMNDLSVQANSREELIAVIKYYIRNINIPEGDVLQVRLSWAAADVNGYYENQGHLVGTAFPYPPLPYASRG